MSIQAFKNSNGQRRLRHLILLLQRCKIPQKSGISLQHAVSARYKQVKFFVVTTEAIELLQFLQVQWIDGVRVGVLHFGMVIFDGHVILVGEIVDDGHAVWGRDELDRMAPDFPRIRRINRHDIMLYSQLPQQL